jgi:hypothetical protein
MNTLEPSKEARAAQTTAFIIGLSLAIGVSVFAIIAFMMQDSGAAPRSPEPEFNRIMMYAWIGLSAVTVTAAVLYWRARVEPLITGVQQYPNARMKELTSNLIICWALVESAALFGVTVYFLTGKLWIGITSEILIWAAFLSTRPRVEWYHRFRD